MAEEPIQQNDAPVTDVTDAPATETPAPPALGSLEWWNVPERKNMKVAYFDRHHPAHEDAVQHLRQQFILQDKKADAAELEAMGGKDAVPQDEQTATVELPPARAGQEWDEGAAAQAIAIAEEAGIPTALIQEAVDVIAKTGAPPMSAEEGEKRLRVIFGAEYDSKLAAANAVLDEFPAMKEFIIASGYANDPGLIFWLAQQGAARGDVQRQIDEIVKSPAYLNLDRKVSPRDHDAAVEKVQKLYQKLYRGE